MSEMRVVICPFSGFEYFITGDEKCPHCGRPHNPFYEIRKKGINWYKKKDQWVSRHSELYINWLNSVNRN